MSGSDRSEQSLEISDSVPEPLRSEKKLHSPFEWYGQMRETASVRFDPQRCVYDVFTYEAVKQSLENGERLARPTLSANRPCTSNPLSYIDEALVWTDGETHSRSKGSFFPFFAPDQIAGMREKIEEIAEDQVHTALNGGARLDFVSEFAVPVPLRVILEFVGVPQRELDQVMEWLVRFRNQKHSEHSAFGDGDASHMAEAVEYFSELVQRRRRDPDDDLVSRLLLDTELDEVTIGSNCFNFILAGQGTLTNLLSNSVYLLDKFDMIGRLDEFDLDVVLEEVLRYRSPLQSRARVATQPITIGGTDIPEGETVILWIGSANRDGEQFENADSFLPRRDPDHLAFGRGQHTCIGAPLARLEAPIALETFFNHAGTATVLDSYHPSSAPSELGFKKLPIDTGG